MSNRIFRLEIGMPHLGTNNLRESALFKSLGHDRWAHLQDLGGVASATMVGEEGLRLYPTFFFLESAFRPGGPSPVMGRIRFSRSRLNCSTSAGRTSTDAT